MLSRPNLLVVLVVISTLHTKGSVQGKFKDGSLEVQKGQTLTINTSNLIASIDNPARVIKLHEHRGSANISVGKGKNNWTFDNEYSVAELKIKNDIIFDKNSKVIIEGKRPLSIQSEQGNIYIGTNVSVTCTKVPAEGETCLGGYMVSKTKCRGYFFSGLGPGGILNKWCEKTYYSNTPFNCTNGAGHGSNGGKVKGSEEYKEVANQYGLFNFQSLIGGSSGNHFYSAQATCYGGGSIEIKAKNGSICIDSTITASASKGTDWIESYAFTGSSGGLIRLVANEVEMTRLASLKAEGSDGSSKINNVTKSGNGGGGGGIIQVVADSGCLYNLSLSPGKSYRCGGTYVYAPPGSGCLVYKELHDQGNLTSKKCSSFIDTLKWSGKANGICAILKSSMKGKEFEGKGKMLSVDEQLDYILNQTNIIKNYTRGNGEIAETSQMFDLLKQLKNISSENNLTGSQLQKVLDIFVTFNGILNKLHRSPQDVKDVFGVLVDVATAVISSRNQINWKKIKKMPALAETLEDMAENIARVAAEYSNCTDLIDVQVTRFDAAAQKSFTFPNTSKVSSPTCFPTNEFIVIPQAALPSHTGSFSFITIIYKNTRRGLPDFIQNDERSGNKHRVASGLTSYRLFNKDFQPITDLKEPANLRFQLYEKGFSKKMCCFWNPDKGVWDKNGLSLHGHNTSTAVCKTSHLTSFAVLMQFTTIPLTSEEKLSLAVITYVGCGLSIMALLKTIITLIVFLRMEALSSERHRIHLNLSIALLIALVLFLTGTLAVGKKLLCQILAGLLHYFYLASFAWMLIEGVHLYLKVVRVFGVENMKITSYYFIGWVIPALIVIIPVIIKPYNYGTNYSCWLSLDDGFVWAFIGPVLAIIVINAFILGTVVKTVVMSASTSRSSDYSHIRAGVKGAVMLMPLMGVTWIFGLLSVNRDTIVFQYLFAITNSLQGVFIFLLHIMFNNEVRSAFKKRWERRQLSKESADFNASYTSTHERSRNSGSRTSGSQSSNNTSKSRFARLKASLSLGMTPRTSRVISVQPFSGKDDDPIIHIERKLNKEASCKLSPLKQDFEMRSSLNCPTGFEEEQSIPKLEKRKRKDVGKD